MKKYLTLSICLVFALSSNAQNQLTFNQVLLVSSLDTVPQGKIWKVTNILPTLDGTGSSKIQVNGNDIVVAFSKGAHAGYYQSGVNYHYSHDYHYTGLQGPYWLPEGTTLQAGINVQYISVIEFNQ